MSYARGLICLRCGRRYELSHYDLDWPACRDEAPSGGVGRHRGGLGQVMEVISLDNAPYLKSVAFQTVSANYDRVLFPPRGRGDGATGTLTLGSGKVLAGKGRQTVPLGESLFIHMPGGGGLGNALTRDPALVAPDVQRGMVSPESAQDCYGAVLRDDGSVNEAATSSLRKGRGACQA